MVSLFVIVLAMNRGESFEERSVKTVGHCMLPCAVVPDKLAC